MFAPKGIAAALLAALSAGALAQAGAPGRVAVRGMPGVATLLDIRTPLSYGQYRWDERGVPSAPLRIRVDKRAQIISVFRGPHEIGTAVVLYGVNAKPTPKGRFPVRDKRRSYWSRTYDAAMPYSLWLTGDGIAIHASIVRAGRGTNGCIGVPEGFARLLFDRARVGTIVEIV